MFLKVGIKNISTFMTMSFEGKTELVDAIIDIKDKNQASKTVSLVVPEASITANQLFPSP
jgi:polyisoprenoid-binding protein YceI